MIDNNNIDTPQTPVSAKEIWLPLLMSLTMIIGIGVGMKLQNEPLVAPALKKKKVDTTDASNIAGQGQMEEILRYINAKYVDNVNNNVLVDKSINNLLQELDPHSVYIPAAELQNASDELEGETDGIGIETIILEDTLNVLTTISESSGAKSGLRTGDKILSVDDSTAIGKDKRWFISRLHGKRGSTFKLKILRGDNNPRPIELTVNRDRMPLHSVESAVMLDNQTGYVKISRFAANTTREFNQALEELFDKKGVKNLVLDLRGNPGGYLEKAVDVLSQFFPEKDKLLVYTKGRTVHKNDYKTSGRQRYGVGKIAILIDEGSASASEIVAGAVQDWDRGIIVGRRSFGKGLVQEPYELADGSELRLTVARYYTPSGRSIQKSYKDKTSKEYENEADNRLKMPELTTPDTTFTQTNATFKTTSGRTVYGGGGISPDITVPTEAYLKNVYFYQLDSWAMEYAYRYYTLHKKELKFKDWREFQRNFRVTDYTFNEILRYAERHGVRREIAQLNNVKDPLRRLVKARIARQLFGDEGYYGILNETDACIRRAVEALQQDDPLGLRQIAQKKAHY